MVDVNARCRATIRSLGMSSWRLWLISKLGQEIDREVVDDKLARYFDWRGVLYTVVTQKEQ